MTGKELFQQYIEMTKQVKAARDAGNTDAVLNLVTRSIPFLEYFEDK